MVDSPMKFIFMFLFLGFADLLLGGEGGDGQGGDGEGGEGDGGDGGDGEGVDEEGGDGKGVFASMAVLCFASCMK